MGRAWNRDELIVAMNLYSRLSFGQLHARQPLIIAAAAKLDRSPDSVAMKLCNLASLDPEVLRRGRVGLQGASRLDREIWGAFHANWNEWGVKSEECFNQLMGDNASCDEAEDWALREGPTESEAVIRRRLGQSFFRRAVLTTYENRCCITGLSLPVLLSASHIVAWSVDPSQRLNPRNGLCLAKTQDAAFDRHLLTLDEEYRIVVSKSLRDHFTNAAVQTNFQPYEGKTIQLPSRFLPDQALLARHRECFARSA